MFGKRWKKFPYWKKGGIILVAIYLALTLILIPFGNNGMIFPTPYWVYPAIPGLILELMLLQFLPMNLVNYIPPSQGFLIAVTSIIGYFLIGAIIGWIAGKIKKRK